MPDEIRAYPSREEAERLLTEAGELNPGSWIAHSRTAAVCARAIADACGMDAGQAYICGLLHDIGRRFGVSHLRHVYDGRRYMNELGYSDCARICLTHSFSVPNMSTYCGRVDIEPEQFDELAAALAACEYDELDRLIQLCDCLAGNGFVMDIAARMDDVARRYGAYPEAKRQRNMELLEHFAEKAGRDIYELTAEAMS